MSSILEFSQMYHEGSALSLLSLCSAGSHRGFDNHFAELVIIVVVISLSVYYMCRSHGKAMEKVHEEPSSYFRSCSRRNLVESDKSKSGCKERPLSVQDLAAELESLAGELMMRSSSELAQMMHDASEPAVPHTPEVPQPPQVVRESVLAAEVAEPAAYVPELADLVLLDGPRVQLEFRYCPAIVTALAATHCTVTVLDAFLEAGIGECWPNNSDVSLMSSRLRLGSRVVINGLSSQRTRHLNGVYGTVCKHPRQAHPSFVCKDAVSNVSPRVIVCVRVDARAEGGKTSCFLLEPRFLSELIEG